MDIETKTILMYEHLYGKQVKVNDRFETICIWSKDLAVLNDGRWVPEEINEQKVLVEVKNIVWTKYEFEVIKSRPPKYDTYFVIRKDGKVHWEKWNGTSWAYNEDSVLAWATIELPAFKI